MAQINADNEFECIREDMRPIPMNIVAAGEHVGDVERSNRTIKERTRCHVHRLPFARYPKEIVIGCVTHSVKSLNQVPADNGISEDQSPATLVTGAPSPDYRHISKLNFGDYVLAHTTRQRTNDNNPRSVEAIALYPTGNAQGSWIFMSLLTGSRIHRYQWDVVPMTKAIQNRVEALAVMEEQPLVADNFRYEWYPGEEVAAEEIDVEEEVQAPNYQIMAPAAMVQDDRVAAAIDAAEEVNIQEEVDNRVIENNAENGEGNINYGPTMDPPIQEIEEITPREVTQPEIIAEEATEEETEEDEDCGIDEIPGFTEDDDRSIESINSNEGASEEDNNIEVAGENDGMHDIPDSIERTEANQPTPSLRRSSRGAPEMDYKALSGIRAYNSHKQMMQLSKKLVRSENPGANHKN